jgi:hypothetical protein
MIDQVDAALRTLLRGGVPNPSQVEVVLDAPTKDWAARRSSTSTVDAYLYDIREDLKRRESGLVNEYGDARQIVVRHLPVRYYKLSYLVTAWTTRPEDEHRILSALLAALLLHDHIPVDLLDGGLAGLRLPVRMTVALPPPEDRSFADVWSALGGELKPSLDVVISTPVVTGQQVQAEKPPTSRRAVVKAKRPGDSWWPTTGKEKEPAEGRLAEAEPGATERRRPPWVAEERSRRWDPQGREGQPRPPAGSGQPQPDGSARKGRHRGDR